MDLGLHGKLVAVTGAGIGAAITRLLVQLGAQIHAADRDTEGLAAMGALKGWRRTPWS